MEDNKPLYEICALWKNETKNGDMYLSGNLGNSKILILKNKNKTEDRQPDYRVLIAGKERGNPNG